MTPEEKVQQLKTLLEADPNDDLGYFMLGKLQMDLKDFSEAARSFSKCLEINPEYSAAWRFLGDAHRLSNDLDSARETYQRGIEVAEKRGDLQTVKEMKAFLRKLEA